MALRCPDIRANSSKVTNTADTGGKKKKMLDKSKPVPPSSAPERWWLPLSLC